MKKVVPAIVEKWPRKLQGGTFLSENIYIQEDNATVHIKQSKFNILIKDIETNGLNIET